jgi:hypothetical protein
LLDVQRADLTDRERQFVERVHQLADALRVIDAVPYAQATPSDLYSQLQRIDVALTKALQELRSLDLRHREGQDVAAEPFNWPLVQALQQRLIATEITRQQGHHAANFMSAAFPTELIDEMESLRDVARSESAYLKPKPGNSAGRSARAAALAKLGKNFVFQYRIWFGELPPISKSGWVVDVMSEALCRAGLEGADAADVLRRAIERDGTRTTKSIVGKTPEPDGGSNAESPAPLKRRRKS